MPISKRNFLKAISCACFFYTYKALTNENSHVEGIYTPKQKKIWPNKIHKVEEFYINSDEDYTDAITKGIAYCSSNNAVLYLSGKYKITKPIILPNNIYILGKVGSLIHCDAEEPISIFYANSSSNINIKGLSVDGKVTENTGKNYTRLVRLVDCHDISIESFNACNSADWCLSFESSSQIRLENIVISGGGHHKPGGRDGIHFLDCSYFYVNGADITSGDDCIGITTQKGNCYYGSINNVVGSSEIGSIVACNEEQKHDKTYYASKTGFITIDNISVKSNGTARNIVRFYAYNPLSDISNIKLSRINGTSYSYGVYIGGATNVTLNGIDVTSLNKHAIYLVKSKNIQAENVAYGLSRVIGYYGVSIFNCENVSGFFKSRNYNGDKKVYVSKSKIIKLTDN
ncbi:hypothetical protein CWM57_21865 [Klebsiella sp. G-Nf4]|uniref:glycosyl hydrolase family 28 protein n=1 Tax=unclassified Klebsiella TaxID=2608929 RepID=UPI000C294814|nr:MULTISPECIES: glycosyl hydrolase family 28 protein [unclassified Klebsiella]PJR53736.1 hypothetical protein CWM64_21905 [Klebsiella sp. I-Nf8]PJX67966.1 hypothetical protein CWM57_21865 [Klebsiella sp. G-Nf4]PJX73856.1 hypothetical protein CWM55_18910 [Klebsiella sp. G2-16S-Nf13]PKJ73598.1 hypothetical protein CWM65_21875 [Klebsiella sp. J-Nf11]